MSTILLVDDEPALLENLEYVLEREGHTVLTASSVNSALGVAQEYPQVIDILVSDVTLAPLDGAQLATAIKTHHKNLAVILISGTPARPSVADEFLQKPFPHAQLLDAINKWSRTIPVGQRGGK
jgi:DNA-binding NtrC family response regulator